MTGKKKSTQKTAKKSSKTGTKSTVKGKRNPRAPRSDSVTMAVMAAQGAGKMLDPPAHVPLQEKHIPFWNSIIDEFASFEWTDHQLELAAVLATSMCRLAEQNFLLDQEGVMIEAESKKKSKRKYWTVNPRNALVQSISATVLSQRRSLSLHARARGGEGRDIGKRRAQAKATEGAIGAAFEDDDDGLIARPPSVQ